jgi:hypothetical protein
MSIVKLATVNYYPFTTNLAPRTSHSAPITLIALSVSTPKSALRILHVISLQW